MLHTFVVLAYKESEYLEECIKSVLNQSYKSNVVIATTTDNKYIRNLAKKYSLEVILGKHTTIGGDFDFARTCVNSKLITIAHQDDVYDRDYASNIVKYYNKYNDSLMIFTDYYEIRDIETAHGVFLQYILTSCLYELLFAFPLLISWLFVRKIEINAVMLQLLPILVILGQIMFFD